MFNGNIIGYDDYGNPIYDNMQPNNMGGIDMMTGMNPGYPVYNEMMPNYNTGNFNSQGFDPNYDMNIPQNYDIGIPQNYDMGMMNNGMFMDNQPNYKGPKENYQFSLDWDKMVKLGFNIDELNLLNDAVGYYGVLSTQKLAQPPFMIQNSILINRVMYAYNICMGRTFIDEDSPISLSKHLKKLAKMQGSYSNFSCANIKHRRIDKIPRTALVAGIPEGSFSVLNSKQWGLMDGTYEVVSIAKEWVTIKSDKPMSVTYQDRLTKSYTNREWGIPGILHVEEVGSRAENKPWVIRIHKKYCRLRNKFLIIATTRKIVPGITKHLGGYQLVLADGTILFVYAKLNDHDSYGNPKDTIPNTNNDTVVIDYGSYEQEIGNKLNKAIQEIEKLSMIVYCDELQYKDSFKILSEYKTNNISDNTDENLDNPEDEDSEYDDEQCDIE